MEIHEHDEGLDPYQFGMVHGLIETTVQNTKKYTVGKGSANLIERVIEAFERENERKEAQEKAQEEQKHLSSYLNRQQF